MKTHIIVIAVLASGIAFCTSAQAGGPIAPPAPFSANAGQIAANWSKLFKKHMTKAQALQQTCTFPSEARVGIKPYPGSLAINMARGGGSVSDSEDVPMVELVTKAPLHTVMAWYKAHYPDMKGKYMFETAGPGISYETRDNAEYTRYANGAPVAFQASRFGGCGGLIEAPDAYRTGVRIYYRPHGK